MKKKSVKAMRELSTKEMVNVNGGTLWRFMPYIGNILTLSYIVDNIQQGWHSVDANTKYH